jgi:putative transposase
VSDFESLDNATPAPGLVLRIGGTEGRYFRLTHVFEDCVYGLWVSAPENARYARRPVRKSKSELDRLASEPGATWGRLTLPAALSTPPAEGSESAEALKSAWALIQPLISAFENEINLSRGRFTALIRSHAEVSRANFITLYRLVRRYYYFGGIRLALLPMPAGVKPNQIAYASEISTLKRRGRQPLLAKEFGSNTFIVSDDDIEDMVTCLKALLRKGPTFMTVAHERYLAGPFRRRHPEIHAEYLANKRVEPVTIKQYRYYVDNYAKLSEDLVKNRRTRQRNPGYLGSLYAAGPGEVYEIDATGGRLVLVSTDDPPIMLAKPTIYLIIDRWSRFVVSVYVSLRPASYEEVRQALLVAFTSRNRRFLRLDVDIDDERWPVGRMPAVLCPDRGSDFMSESMEQAIVQDLRVELTPLPPFCPDGKAIVERLIREIKRRMASSNMKGTYADRPLDPDSKRAVRAAKEAAVHSLAEVYRKLIEIVDDHNNRPHSTLRRRRVLTQSGVPPTPQKAYLWGLKHITGLRMPPLTDEDYHRLLLSVDTASLAKGVLRYKNRPYFPVNEVAFDLANRSTLRAKQIDIRLDKTDPTEIRVPTPHGEWALFRLTPGAESELAGLSLDEEDVFASQTATLWARAEHAAKVERVAALSAQTKSPRGRKEQATTGSRREQRDARARETADLKQKLTGKVRSSDSSTSKITPEIIDWEKIEEEERLQNLKLIRQHRSKQ